MTKNWKDVLKAENVGEREHVCDLPGGEKVEIQGRSLIVLFPNKSRHVLSSANFNGGLFKNPQAVFNTTGIGGEAEKSLMNAGQEEHLLYFVECAKKVGLDPKKVIGLGTAVTMDKASIVTKTVGKTSVSAIVTAGVEGNGGRAGDPAYYDEIDGIVNKKGTIVIILLIQADLPDHVLARTIITATEAKTCALQQLMAPSKYSTGIATGSGTDQIAVVCNKESKIQLSDAGKHSLLGELIGKCVTEGVLKALNNWANLNPQSQRDAYMRLSRYKVNDLDYLNVIGDIKDVDKEMFLKKLREISLDEKIVTYIAAVVHIQDEITWELITEEVGRKVANRMLLDLIIDKNLNDNIIEENKDIIYNAIKTLSYIALDTYTCL